ncbi:PDZ domain-containing protein [Micrococcales bacterium 31B]|nr:PDZ domain-containing protein [Micrococcales bacterium 31B]
MPLSTTQPSAPNTPATSVTEASAASELTPATRPWRLANTLAGVVTLVIVLAALLVPMPYAIEMPGPLANVLGETEVHAGSGQPTKVDMINIEGTEIYEPTGELDLTTVSVRGGPGYPVRLPELVAAWFNPTYSVTPVENVFPRDFSREQVSQANTEQMTQSQDQATLNAIDLLGIKYTTDIVVGSIDPSSPNGKVFQIGDRITAVQGAPVTTADALVKAVQGTPVGGTVDFTVDRAGETVDVTATTYAVEGVSRIGVVLRSEPQLPFTISIQIEDIGGPSAGTMFALGIIDKLTPGELTGGQRIAGTGTQEAGGVVGAIGGIPQKMEAAHDAGIRYFLIPAGNCAEAMSRLPEGMTGVKITTLADAKTSVETIASQENLDTLPSCSS